MRSLHSILALAVGSIAALALTASSPAVVGGTPDSSHVYVGAVETPDGNGGFELCSGSLLSATVLVTAAHCFPAAVPCSSQPLPVQTSVTFAEDASSPGAVFVTGTAYLDPNFCPGFGNGLPGADTGDIAVVTLSSPVPMSRYATLPAPGQAGSLMNGQVDVVGYGIQGFSGKAPTAVGSREIAPTTVKGNGAISAEFLKLLADPGACPGDSGGPDLVHGTDTVVAITSFSGGNPGCNGVSYSERLDTQAALAFVCPFLPSESEASEPPRSCRS